MRHELVRLDNGRRLVRAALDHYLYGVYGVVDSFQFTFTVAGNYCFKNTVMGKNLSRGGYDISFDRLTLPREEIRALCWPETFFSRKGYPQRVAASELHRKPPVLALYPFLCIFLCG